MKRFLAAVLCLVAGAAYAQLGPGNPKSYLSTVSTNCTLVQTGSVELLSGLFINTTTALSYLKIYDTSVAPTAGAGTPIRRIPIPFGASNAGGGVMDIPPGGLALVNGLGFCLTGAIADSDATNAGVGITINFTIR